jgi:hypothetical protein
MHQQTSGATGDVESTRVYRKHTNGRQDGHHIHRQTDSRMTLDWLQNSNIHASLIEEIKKEMDGDGKNKLENSILLR